MESPTNDPRHTAHQEFTRRLFTAAADHWERTNAQQQNGQQEQPGDQENDGQNDSGQVSGGGSAVATS